MITELLQKQLESNLELIYTYLNDFVTHFFSKEEAAMVIEDTISYFMAFNEMGLYIQKHWVGEDNENRVEEVTVEYEDYNKWVEGVNK